MFLYKKRKILMVYIEPTPYVIGLIKMIKIVWKGKIDILFFNENKSQQWNILLNENWIIFAKKENKFKFFYELFVKNKYDLLHLAGWSEPLCLIFIILAKLFRIPVSVESDTCDAYKTNFTKKIIKKITYPLLFKLINLFLVGGNRQAKYIEQYGVNRNNINIVQMTVDVKAMQNYAKYLTAEDKKRIRTCYKIGSEATVFLFVGRLVIQKGLNDLILAFNKLEHAHAYLLIAGEGPLTSQVIEVSKANEKIHYVGRLSDLSLFNIYFASDVLVLPSHFESWGLVINEAMAFGLPVIVSERVGCIDDLVIHKKTGLIVKAENSNDLCDAFKFIIANPEDYAFMKRNALKQISQWTLQNEAKKICNSWHKLVH